MYEVEQKFHLDDSAALRSRLRALGASFDEPVVQVDVYYAHPMRDFGATDEALRIRQVGEQNFVTYKGPKLDPKTKTRREIEVPLAPGQAVAGGMGEVLEALGFVPFGTVRKTRRTLQIPWQGRHIEGAWDEVDGLGAFFELELTADPDTLDAARSAVASLAEKLGLGRSERRSYLELLTERRENSGS